MTTPALLLAALLCSGAPALAQETPATGQEPEPTPQQPPRQGGGADPSDDAFEMGSPAALPEGVAEEEIWPAATAEGWLMPCLVPWQRSFDDALRVARAQHKPILVAVNMDGEIASEHFAGVRYRQADTAELLGGYACVVASVYRHTPRDYDEEGQRVECPRFQTVTCGEHIEAERELFEKYFDGKRISPRHIVLDVEGSETYDVYYSWDTATVFTTFVEGRVGWPEPLPRKEPTIANLVKSADVADRQVLEKMYAEGDRESRRRILVTLGQERVVDQVEVLRAAVFGLDLELARLGRRALAGSETEGALDLMAEALKAPLEADDRELLLNAVGRLAKTSKRARTLGALHSGLSLDSRLVDPAAGEALAKEYERNSGRPVDVQARAEAAEARPTEPGALLELAEALLGRAVESTDPRYKSLWLEDARSAAREAERLGAKGARLDAVAALTADQLGDRINARARAVAAVEAGLLRSGDTDEPAEAEGAGVLSGASRARLLRLFAEQRQWAIRSAYRSGDSWPPEWLSDVNAAYSTLAAGPMADPEPLVEYHDFLRWIGATPRANTVLDEALRRFPDSAVLHDRLRARLLWEDGPKGLEQGYSERLARAAASSAEPNQLTWFAAYASLVAAEHHRRRGEFEGAVAAYGRAIAGFEKSAELFPDGEDNCAHFIALGLAGRSRVALESGALDKATRELLAALERRPDSAATPDGLNLTPVQTAKMLKARLLEAGDTGRAARVQQAMDSLDPRLLEPPPSELPSPRRRGPPRGRPDDTPRGG